MLERDLVREILRALRARGWFAEKNHGSAYMRAGLPDITCVADGFAVYIEAKQPGKRATPVQLTVQQEIRDAGGWAGVIDNIDDISDLLLHGPTGVCKECLQHDCRCKISTSGSNVGPRAGNRQRRRKVSI